MAEAPLPVHCPSLSATTSPTGRLSCCGDLGGFGILVGESLTEARARYRLPDVKGFTIGWNVVLDSVDRAGEDRLAVRSKTL